MFTYVINICKLCLVIFSSDFQVWTKKQDTFCEDSCEVKPGALIKL